VVWERGADATADGLDAELPLRRVAGGDPVPLAAGRRALGWWLLGTGHAMLSLARAHALDRVQFGRPIARFQAVRHRLAETLVAIETAAGVLDAAWLDPSPVTAAMAKATAGRGARVAAKHCQQVLAGIGFTTEHDLHLHLRRIWMLDQLFGSSAVLTKQLGQDLLASRRLPPLLPL
jgi:alkylation response protein AidB-like acyl-CoA dehydrogenase